MGKGNDGYTRDVFEICTSEGIIVGAAAAGIG